MPDPDAYSCLYSLVGEVPDPRLARGLRHPIADVLFITGVTLVNHTLEGILRVARPEAEIAVIGPTASFIPDILFDRGVRVVGGVWVKKPDKLLDVLAAGGSGYHLFDQIAPRIVSRKQT